MINYELLTIQNPWWKNRGEIDTDSKIKEFQDSKLKYYPKEVLDLKLEPGAVNILSGPRQTGKSTALKLLIKNLLGKENPKNILYFNCDALDSKKDIINLILNFKKETGSQNYLFLDEISSVPDWPYAIKWLADAGELAKSKIILTGSSSINLKKSGEFLPGRRGRGKDIRFLPIDFFEHFKLLNPEFKDLKRTSSFAKLQEWDREFLTRGIRPENLYRDYLLTGGFLKLINLAAAKKPLSEAVSLYVNTLKSELAKFGKKEINARPVIKKITHSLTSETSYANIAEEAELGSKNTAAEYLNFLKDSFFILETLFYSIPQKRVSIKKNKKFYPTDPALLWIFHSFVYGTPDIENFYRDYLKTPLDSRLAEAFAASELYKRGFEAHYFKNTHELDFYLPKLNLGLEVKYKEKITTADLAGLKPAAKKILISKNTLEQRGKIRLIPAHLMSFLEI